MSSTVKGILSFVLVMVLIIVGILTFKWYLGKRITAPKHLPPPKLIKVDYVVTDKGNYPETITAFSTVQPARRAAISVEVPGRVISRHENLHSGGFVAAGDLLFEIDGNEIDEQMRAAKIEKEAVNIQFEQLKLDMKNLRELIAVAEEELAYARREVKRIGKLVEPNGSDASSALPQTALDKAQSGERRARNGLLQLQGRYEQLPVRTRQLKNRLAAADSKISLLKIRLGKCSVRSPFDAVVLQSSLEVSQVVAPGAPLVTLIDAYRYEMAVELFGRQAEIVKQRLTAGEKIPCVVISEAGDESSGCDGVIDRLAPDAEPFSHAVRVIAAVNFKESPKHEPDRFVSGETVKVSFELERHKGTVLLPRAALVPDSPSDPDSAYHVFAIASDSSGAGESGTKTGDAAATRSVAVEIVAELPRGVLVHGLGSGIAVAVSNTGLLYESCPVINGKPVPLPKIERLQPPVTAPAGGNNVGGER